MHTGFVFSIKVCGLRLIHIYSLSIYSSKMLYLGWNHGQQCAFFMTVIKILNIMRLRLYYLNLGAVALEFILD